MVPQSGEDERSPSGETNALRSRLGIAISISALVVVAVHLIWPRLKIDAVTLVLIGVAVAPWLAPLFKSIELPGGLRLEYQEIQRQVREVQRRVEGVERLVFSGDTTPPLEAELTHAVQAFAAYLRDIEPTLDVPLPSVHVKRGMQNAHYVEQRIELDPDFAEDSYAVQREYAHHVLMTVHGQLPWDVESGYAALESGVADYLVASFTGEPGLGAALARRLRERMGFDQPYIRNLANDLTLDPADPSPMPQRQGEIWGAAFWELRRWCGQAHTDHLLVKAWLDEKWIADGCPPPGFPAVLIADLHERDHDRAREIFERRRLPMAVD